MTAANLFQLYLNEHHGVPGVVVLPQGGYRRAAAEIRAWPGHMVTPLQDAAELAATMGLGRLSLVQAHPGLGCFAGVGAAYAVVRAVLARLARQGVAASARGLWCGEHADDVQGMTIACPDDGPHAAAVAWASARVGVRCRALLPVASRWGGAAAGLGAGLMALEGDARERERTAAILAEREGWLLISAVSAAGYTEVPRDMMQGYRLLAEEAMAQLPAPPTHIIVSTGVAGVAAAISVQARAMFGPLPRLVLVGRPDSDPADILPWQELERSAFAVLTAATDEADGLLALRWACGETVARQRLGLDASGSSVVFFGDGGNVTEWVRGSAEIDAIREDRP